MKGDYDVAEALFAEALDKGGLGPDELLEAYIDLGGARAVQGKKAAALAAFKNAALIDLQFAVPTEVGKRATPIAESARRQMKRVGQLSFHAEIPAHIAPQTRAGVDVTLDPAHAATPGTSLGITARDVASGASHSDSVPAAPTAHFDLPAALSLPSATLRVRVDWVDAHANRLASIEEPIHVQALSPFATVPPGAVVPPPESGSRRGFWHSPWPYILGTAALAGGAVAIYFATRPSGDVDVTGAHVVTH
jgi:hypothetical protein